MNLKLTLPALALAASLTTSVLPVAASPLRPAADSRIELDYGLTTVKLGAMTLRIVKGLVGTGTANSYDTYTVYIMPARPKEPWMQVTGMPEEGGYNFRAYESGDANTQAVGFFKEGRQLYAVLATKIGAAADAHGPRKTPFRFEVFQFNGSDEIPLFNSEAKGRSTGKYVDGTEALEREFFAR